MRRLFDPIMRPPMGPLTGESRLIGALKPTYLPASLPSNSYIGVWGMSRMLAAYSGPLFAVCASGAAATPPSSVDVSVIAGGDLPDYTAAIAAYGANFDLYKVYDQTGNGNVATYLTTASRIKIYTGTKPFGLVGASGLVAATGGSATIPTLSIASRQSITSGGVIASYGNQDNNVVMGLGDTGSPTTVLTLFADKRPATASGNLANVGTRHGTVQPYFAAQTSSASANVIYVNDTVSSKPAQSAVALTSGALWGGQASGAGSFGFSYGLGLCGFVIAGVVSGTDMLLLKNACYAKYGISDTYTGQLVCAGDSIQLGLGSSQGLGFAYRLQPYLTSRTVKISNLSRGFETLATGNTNYATTVGLAYKAGLARNVLHINYGINDILTNGVTDGTTLFNNMVTYVNKAKTTGFDVVVSTLLPCGTLTAPQTIVRNDYNAALIAGAAANGYTVNDRATLASMANTSGTSYSGDTIHPSDIGYQNLADFEGPTLNSRLA